MFDNKSRQQLENLRSTLRNFEQTVSERAKGFHRLRRLLEGDIDAELRRFFPRKAAVEGYLQRYEPLARVAADLAGLLRQSQLLESELEGLLALFAKERRIADYGEICCRQWREELRRLPGQCEREADLTAAKRDLEQIELSIRLHGEALRAFQEADAIVRGLGGPAETAALDSELSAQRQALVAGRVSLEGIRQIKKLCAPLDALLKQPTPQELQSLSQVLTEIRLWNSALDASPEQERGLEQRRRQLGTDWRRRDPDAAKALLEEAEALRERLIQQGLELRELKRRELEELLDDLARACGPQPDIRQQVDALRQGGFDSANRHKEWMDRFNGAEGLFKDTAKNHELALEQRLRERRTDVGGRLQSLRGLPLGAELRRQAEELEAQAEALGFAQDSQDLLKSLRLGNELSRQIDELAGQSREECQALDTALRRLQDSHMRLAQQAARLGLSLEDLPPAPAVLGEGVVGVDVDQARDWLADQTARLARQQQEYLAHCQSLRAGRQAEIDRCRHVLEETGYAVPAAAPAPEPVSDELGAWVDWLMAQQQALQRTGQAVEQAVAGLGQRCRLLRESLLALGPDSLLPSEVEEREGLLQALADSEIAEAPALERLRVLSAAALACERMLERLSAERDGWQAQLDALKQDMQTFTQERLKAYCPEEWFSRASDLAYGIPVPPRRIHQAQLREAKQLFDSLERHALRRAATVVDQQIAVLERQSHPRAPEVEALLAELRGLSDEQPVPAALRQRLQAAVATAGV